MSLIVSGALLEKTLSEELKPLRDRSARQSKNNSQEFYVDVPLLSNDSLKDLAQAAEAVLDRKSARAIESILQARSGKFDKPIPSFKAFQAVLESFLKHDLIDGWLYVVGDDNKLYPELVTGISFDIGAGNGGKDYPSVTIKTVSCGAVLDGRGNGKFGLKTKKHIFTPGDVTRRRIADILIGNGLYKETLSLKEDYLVSLERHDKVTKNAFAKQFRVNGGVHLFHVKNYQRRGIKLENRKVIHDLDASSYAAVITHIESSLLDDHPVFAGVGEIPELPVVRVFDLVTHEFMWVHSDNMDVYKYDKTLRDKLILPTSHRDLLDVLTSDISSFVDDIIEGKSAGNVILCKGIPGVGKTLTAEVYAELIESPLYTVHTGLLGTTAEQIAINLRDIFQQCRRWGCTLLLDEADVFVVRRGGSIEQNAIVAEFLRTLEYFDGLMFMTTNRPYDIDEAIISRCAAIIEYHAPDPENARAIWSVMANQNGVQIGDDLVDELVSLFPSIAPRDIKMLLRLALRVSRAKDQPLSIDTFRRCAMFRAVVMKES